MAEAASTPEADRVPQVDASEIYWAENTTVKGQKYRIGVAKSDHPDLSEQEVKDLLVGIKPVPQEKTSDRISGFGDGKGLGMASASAVLFKITHDTSDGDNPCPVSWPDTGSDDSWKNPGQRIKDIFDITQYCLCNNTGFWYDHTLWIDVREAWNYRFYDESGDYYDLSTYKTGSHYVDYDSNKPNIKRIIAWSWG